MKTSLWQTIQRILRGGSSSFTNRRNFGNASRKMGSRRRALFFRLTRHARSWSFCSATSILDIRNDPHRSRNLSLHWQPNADLFSEGPFSRATNARNRQRSSDGDRSEEHTSELQSHSFT